MMKTSEVRNLYKIAKIALIAVAAGIAGVILIIILQICSSSYGWRYARYSERFIIGNSIENITDRYGEFDILKTKPNGDVSSGWYLVYEGNDVPDNYYAISFDADGVATKVEKNQVRPGDD